MLVTYRPADGEAQTWVLDPERLRSSDAELIEKRYGDLYPKWVAGVQAGEVRARRVLLWHLIRATHHTLRFEDTPDFVMAELVVEMDVAELTAIRDRVSKTRMAADEKEPVLAALDVEIAEAMARAGDAPGE